MIRLDRQGNILQADELTKEQKEEAWREIARAKAQEVKADESV